MLDKNNNEIMSIKQSSTYKKILSFIPLINIIVKCPYLYYSNGIVSGQTKKKYACFQVEIGNTVYKIKLHTGNKVTIWVSERMVGLLYKIKPILSENDRCILKFSTTLSIELGALLSIYALMELLDDPSMEKVIYTIVPFSEQIDSGWEPEIDT